MDKTNPFDGSLEYPDPDAERRLASLVGVDDQRARLEKNLRMLLDRASLVAWSMKHYDAKIPLVEMVLRRPPLFVLEGDVGTGKTALAESIGDAVARSSDLDITLHRLSLSSRGEGLVGQMTTLLRDAFEQFLKSAKAAKSPSGKAKAAHLMLIDEADALAQSRENMQMHHEDRAGVNALIRGINDLAEAHAPAAVIMCTNRVGALDPAILRRAAEVLTFTRPNGAQRRRVIEDALQGSALKEKDIDHLVTATEARGGRPSFTYSDITQRLLPNIALDAYPDTAITAARALEVARGMKASPSFVEQKS